MLLGHGCLHCHFGFRDTGLNIILPIISGCRHALRLICDTNVDAGSILQLLHAFLPTERHASIYFSRPRS